MAQAVRLAAEARVLRRQVDRAAARGPAANLILDIHELEIDDPQNLENCLNNIVGVVTNGLFANRGADILLLGSQNGVIIKHSE